MTCHRLRKQLSLKPGRWGRLPPHTQDAILYAISAWIKERTVRTTGGQKKKSEWQDAALTLRLLHTDSALGIPGLLLSCTSGLAFHDSWIPPRALTRSELALPERRVRSSIYMSRILLLRGVEDCSSTLRIFTLPI